MEKTEERKYCIICVDNTYGMKDTILSIALDPYKYVDGDNMLIVTFSTYLTPLEMKDVFGYHDDRSYFLFEMSTDNAMVSIANKKLQSYLFDSLVNTKDKIDVVDTKFGAMGVNNINNDIESNNSFLDIINKGEDELDGENKYSKEELDTYTKEERDELVDELLEKGNDLTDEDKEVLSFLINKKD